MANRLDVDDVTRHLFIVSREQPDLYSYLAKEFSEEPDVRVIFDRRQGERRRQPRRPVLPTERRQSDRRANGDLGRRLATLGYAFVRV
jgi:hypothetical protein